MARLVNDVAIEDLGNEADADTGHLVRSGSSAGQNGGPRRFHRYDANIRLPLFQHFPHAGDRASGTDC